MKQRKYKNARKEMWTGDIICFDGNSPFSQLINVATGKCKNDHYISHVAMILETMSFDNNIVQLIESTKKDDNIGVQINRMSDHVRDYDGKIWWYPIRRDIHIKTKLMVKWLLAQEGKPYDLRQAMFSTLDFVPQEEDFAKLFCSELCDEALEIGGVIKKSNASRIDPIEIIDKHYDIYWQQKVCQIIL